MTLTGFQDSFHLLDPVFLFLLMPLVALFILWVVITALRLVKRPKRTFGSKYPLIGKGKLWGLSAFPAGVLMVLAMAKPSLNYDSFKTSQGRIEVIIVIDRSISMRADDVKPSRLVMAKHEAANIESFLGEGDGAALFVFGRESHKKMYLSERLENVFDQISRISFPGSLRGDGLIWDSDFVSMLENIYQSLDRQDSGDRDYLKNHYVPQKRSNRIVIIFSDGEDQFRKNKPATPKEAKSQDEYLKRLNNALEEFRKRGLKIYPVGIGTQKGVSWPSLLRGYKKSEDYPEYLIKNWQNGISRIDKENLLFLAQSTGNRLGNNIWMVENDTATVKSYLSLAIRSNRSVKLEVGHSETNQDMGRYFLIAVVGILALGILFYPVSGYFRKRK
jgi:hypothetical protein